jgi:RNase P subunit RPR2
MHETDMNNPKVKYMICDLCHKKLHPLDAHMIRINGKLDVAHIDCCNEVKRNKE